MFLALHVVLWEESVGRECLHNNDGAHHQILCSRILGVFLARLAYLACYNHNKKQVVMGYFLISLCVILEDGH